MVTDEAPKKQTTSVKSTRTARKVREVVRTMNSRAHDAKAQGRPVAYCMAGSFFNEMLVAMDITPVWTENYAGLCAVTQDAGRFLQKAESDGYSNVVCGYARTGLGFDAMRNELGMIPPDAPDGGMPEPDILLGSSSVCDPRFKWYQALGRYKNTPFHCHDVVIPPLNANLAEAGPYYVAYQVEEFKHLIAFLEKHTGRKMDYAKLSHHLAIANETYMTWWKVDQLRRAVPSPMASEDHFVIFVPGLYRLGEQETLDFYRELYAEIKDRVDHKIGIISDEKYRLMWAGGLPPWHTMGMLFNDVKEMGAVFAIENAYFPFDPVDIPVGVENPLEHLAWRIFKGYTVYYEKARKNKSNPTVERLLQLVKDYQIDGMVMHATISCRATTVGQIFLRNMINEHIKIPCLFLTSDIIDIRNFSEAEWMMQINGFMETIRTQKNSG